MLDIGPRDMVDGMLLVGSLGAFAYALSQRVSLGLDVIRDRKALFREVPAGENAYTSKVLNMDERPIAMTSTPRGPRRRRPARSSRSRCA